MNVHEILLEEMPKPQAIAKIKQDAKNLKAMADSGDIDANKAIPMMQDMATMAAKADMGSKLLMFFDKMAGAIKKGIDTNQYSAKDLPTMQKAYDEMMAQMPALKKIAADSRRLAVQHGGAGRQDVGEKDTQTITVTKKNPLAKGDLVDVQKMSKSAKAEYDRYEKELAKDKNKTRKIKIPSAKSLGIGEEDDPFIKSIDNSFGKGPVARQIGFSPTGELYKAIYRAIKAVMPEADEAEVKKAAKSATDSMQESIGEDMNAIIAKKGKEKHGEKYMDAARSMAQQKGRKLTPDERDRLRNKHSDNRKKANETVAGDVGSIAQSMNKGNMVRRNIYNADGTMKNGLDFGNLLGGSSKPKKAKKRRV